MTNSGTSVHYLDGPAGQLEALWSPTAATTQQCALLCHPHPQYGGSMHDSVLAIAAEVLSAHGYSHLRFNFRGVGGSDGSYANGEGERDDIAAAWQWLINEAPQPDPGPESGPTPDRAGTQWDKKMLVGYSFGAATAWAARAKCASLDALMLIAPPTQSMTFAGAAGSIPSWVIVGDNDSYCDQATLPAGTAAQVIAGADHFFSGASQALGDAIASALS